MSPTKPESELISLQRANEELRALNQSLRGAQDQLLQSERLASIGQGVFKRNLIGIGNAPASADNSNTKHLAATACAILDR